MALDKCRDIYDLAKEYIREKTKRLLIAREWLKRIDPTLFFQEPDEETQDQ